MIPISSSAAGGLVWSKTPYQCGYELRRNGETVGRLERKSFWSSEFHAESAQGRWKFRRTGCFRTATEIVDASSGARIAILRPNWTGGGALEFGDGLTFRLTSKGFWRPVWMVETESGQPVLSVRSREKTVELRRELPLPEERLTLLAIFAWHIMRQASEDAASAAVLIAG
jgi:hypothetical protein